MPRIARPIRTHGPEREDGGLWLAEGAWTRRGRGEHSASRNVARRKTSAKGHFMFTQLDPPIPLHIMGKGDGYAVAVIDYSQEHDLIWVTALNESGEIWCAPNPVVRLRKNWTAGRQMQEARDQTGR